MTSPYRSLTSKAIAAAALLMLAAAMPAVAAPPQPDREKDEPDRGRYITELRNYKHDFLTRELKLTREQQRDFFPLYDQMEDKIFQINDEIREIERKIENDDDASGIEIESAAQVVYSQKLREGETEMEYYPRFKEILDSKQLMRLRSAERRFTQKLMRFHRRSKRQEKHDGAEQPDSK